MEKALGKAPSDKRSRYEDVLLRIDAGTDLTRGTLGPTELEITEAALTSEVLDGKGVLRAKVVFQGSTIGEKAEVVTLAKGTLYTVKGKMGLLVKGAKGEAFTRTFDPMTPKMFEYGAILPPRYSTGTRAVIVFDVESETTVDGKKQTVTRSIRSPVFVVSKKE